VIIVFFLFFNFIIIDYWCGSLARLVQNCEEVFRLTTLFSKQQEPQKTETNSAK
jgi:hypothetical protein